MDVTEQERAAKIAEARDWMRCMDFTRKGTRCKRRMVCGTYEGGRYVRCAQHARLARMPVWMWGR